MERLGFSDLDPSQLVNPAGALGSVLKKGQVPLITKAVRLFDKPVSKNELEALEKAIPPGGKVERLLGRWGVEYPPSRLMPESFRHSQEEGRYYHNIPEHKEPLRRRLVTTQHHLYAGGSPLSRKRTPKHLRIPRYAEARSVERRVKTLHHEFGHDIIENIIEEKGLGDFPVVGALAEEIGHAWSPRLEKYNYLSAVVSGNTEFLQTWEGRKDVLADIVAAYMGDELPEVADAPITNLVIKEFLEE